MPLTAPESATGIPVAIDTSVTGALGPIQDAIAPSYLRNQETLEIGMGTRAPPSQLPLEGSKGYYGALPTPINVNNLERALSGHPDRSFVSTLCSTLKHGVDVGYSGSRVSRFSRNLPTALEQPHVVTANLLKEVALGRVAGPFSTPPFPSFQVSPIGLVPKKHSDKFRTIFHLSFPKS